MFPHCSVVSIYQFLTLWMNGAVTIASVRAHGVRQLLVYCISGDAYARRTDLTCPYALGTGASFRMASSFAVSM
jgi:hypothetical protein